MSIKKPIRVGFDLDGVLLYNPVRIVRPIISLLKKKKIIQRKEMQFFVPTRKWEMIFWRLFHKTSLFVSPGIKEIERLVKAGEIEAYVVTARFKYLQPDTQYWFNKFAKKKIFKTCYLNEKNEQPHLFKARKIDELKLDYFVEDNWDIVQFLNKKFGQKKKIFWITNLVDNKKNYEYKFLSLQKIFKSLPNYKPKLLFFSPYFYPHKSGITQYSLKMLSEIANKYSITVLSFKFSARLKNFEYFNGLKIIRMPFLFYFKKGFISFQSIIYFFKNLINTDLVVVDYPNLEGLPLIIFAKLMRKKIVTAFHCKIQFETGLINYLIKKLLEFSALVHLDLSDKVAVLADDYFYQFSSYQKYSPKIKEIHPHFGSEKKDQLFFKKIKQQKKKNIWLGFVGRIASEKGIETLLKALQKLPANHQLIIAGPSLVTGENEYRKKVLKIVENQSARIIFFNDLNNNKLVSLFSLLDVLILPSEKHTEAFGIVQLEAMEQGIPVVASNLPGIRVPVLKTGLGMLFKPKDEFSLYKAIKQTLDKRQLKDKTKNIKKFNQIFSSKETVNQFLDLLRKI
ncbi:MAG: hypothetical protein COU63_04345 [Candidatus Pacebacteria bacterium CG10_big_fil_rev_8_21_14_0_10_36_11]|nr:glycosyltransferase family 4 protein [Candidatus Pacearchaeota archaeon]OIP74123.1 MAG: hypothetical protein AUK08_02620 [Candidatus Pacebacteria bacterium CG2_30_36_39]PIR64491.1 MAG: hypothetical protein COU63_04345 [Candidatus Pacebacteria bacterium CG10_big_fil_rev_8_21_14_0_10_36_11]